MSGRDLSSLQLSKHPNKLFQFPPSFVEETLAEHVGSSMSGLASGALHLIGSPAERKAARTSSIPFNLQQACRFLATGPFHPSNFLPPSLIREICVTL
jgi:hypothetical protein